MRDPDAELLRVAPDAPLSDIKRAYRKAALAHHPDQSAQPEAARQFRRITEAYRALEARAQVREPARPRQRPLTERLGLVVSDIRSLVRRWPDERWATPAWGLPPVVWVASALEVVARAWPGAEPTAVAPSVTAIALALEAWDRLLGQETQGSGGPVEPSPPLTAAVAAAEARVQALVALAPGRRRAPR